jgi:fructose-bisphosphate aldolase class II
MALSIVPPGVLTGDNVMKLLKFAQDNNFAIPAVNCVSSTSANAVLEAAREVNSPVIIQFSQGGCSFFAGKGLKDTKEARSASIAGAIAAAYHVRLMAKHYGVPVILHTDHCAKKLLPWFEGMVKADEAHYAVHGEPLFSSHMLDLSEEPLHENIEICLGYLKRLAKINCLLEMELGITGGEEDGVDNTGVDNKMMYSQPDEVWQVYSAFSKITDRFTIAAAFGNVHGVYKPGNVKLTPSILSDAQKYIAAKLGTSNPTPVYFVFHGGSGSEKDKIAEAVKNGVIKFNIDTDTQWAYWNGVRKHEAKFHDYLQGQIGNPEGSDKPNKKKYDPRKWLRQAEKSMIERLKIAFTDLNCLNRNGVRSKL